MALSVETAGCDPETDAVWVNAVIGESTQFTVVDRMWDQGSETDDVAGDGRYDRTIGNPFSRDIPPAEAGLYFEVCDPECRGPSVEVPVRVDPPLPF